MANVRTKSDVWAHIDAEGGNALLALRNIICHLEVLLTDAQKVAINWHPQQSVSLAVMRVLSDGISSDRAVQPEGNEHEEHSNGQRGLPGRMQAIVEDARGRSVGDGRGDVRSMADQDGRGHLGNRDDAGKVQKEVAAASDRAVKELGEIDV